MSRKLLLLGLLFLASCDYPLESEKSKIIWVRNYDETHCIYGTTNGKFIDSCNKFHVGDLVKVEKYE